MAWDAQLNVSRWAKQLAYEVGKEIYFSKFMGDTFGSMIVSQNNARRQG